MICGLYVCMVRLMASFACYFGCVFVVASYVRGCIRIQLVGDACFCHFNASASPLLTPIPHHPSTQEKTLRVTLLLATALLLLLLLWVLPDSSLGTVLATSLLRKA